MLFERCTHRDAFVVWTRFSNGGEQLGNRQLRHWCPNCRRMFGSSLRHSLATPDTPEISQEDAAEFTKKAIEEINQRSAERERQGREQAAERRAFYDAHLQSPEWAELR